MTFSVFFQLSKKFFWRRINADSDAQNINPMSSIHVLKFYPPQSVSMNSFKTSLDSQRVAQECNVVGNEYNVSFFLWMDPLVRVSDIYDGTRWLTYSITTRKVVESREVSS